MNGSSQSVRFPKKPANHPRNALLDKTTLQVVAAMVFVGGVTWWALRSPPAELSENQYRHVMSLYRACNQKSPDAVDRVEQSLQTTVATDDAGTGDDLIRAVIQNARDGHWSDAEDQCRRLMNDQIRRP